MEARQAVGAGRHHQQQAAAAVRPHGAGQLQAHVHGRAAFGGGGYPRDGRQRGAQGGVVGQALGFLVHHPHVVAAQHGHVHELAEAVGPAVLGHQQAGLHHFQHEAHRRHPAGRAPQVQALLIVAYPQVHAGVLHGRGQLNKRLRREAQPVPKPQRMPRFLGCEQGQRNARRPALLAPQAGPEGHVNQRFEQGRGRGGG